MKKLRKHDGSRETDVQYRKFIIISSDHIKNDVRSLKEPKNELKVDWIYRLSSRMMHRQHEVCFDIGVFTIYRCIFQHIFKKERCGSRVLRCAIANQAM